MAILFLFLTGFSKRTSDDRQDFLEILKRFNKHYLHLDGNVPMATVGNAIIGGFENPTNALMCASGYLHTLRDLSIDAYACVNMGTAAIRQRENSNWVELVTDSISPGARLEPLASPGEVLVLEELQSHPGTDKEQFLFTKVSRQWKKLFDASMAGVNVICYQVQAR